MPILLFCHLHDGENSTSFTVWRPFLSMCHFLHSITCRLSCFQPGNPCWECHLNSLMISVDVAILWQLQRCYCKDAHWSLKYVIDEFIRSGMLTRKSANKCMQSVIYTVYTKFLLKLPSKKCCFVFFHCHLRITHLVWFHF